MMRRSVASVRGDAEFNMGRRIVHGFASRSLLLRAKVPCAVAHESLHETAARYGAEERRRRETFESKRLVSPLRGSIETWLLTHGLRRGLRLFRAFGALRNGNGFAPKHRTLQPTRAFPRALLLRAGRKLRRSLRSSTTRGGQRGRVATGTSAACSRRRPGTPMRREAPCCRP